jgi:hypothetical protein
MPEHDAVVIGVMRAVSDGDVKTFRKVLGEIEQSVGDGVAE